jgi:hypothetical protein
MAGWPVNLGTGSVLAGRMIGENLMILTGVEVSPDRGEVWTTRIGVDGVPHQGVRVAIDTAGGYFGLGEWAIGPDRVAYGTLRAQAIFQDWTPAEYDAKAKSALFAVGPGGIAAGFPVSITGWASQPAFDGAGRVHLVVGSIWGPPTRVLVFDTAGRAATGGSGALDIAAPMDAISIGPDGHLAPPLVGEDGTTFLPASSGEAIALGPSGQPLAAGWPYRSDVGLQQTIAICRPPQGAVDGTSFAAPAVGPGNVLYLLLSAANPSIGGSIMAIGIDGRVRPGWPRTLKRASGGFHSVVVGSDGTAFALAIERESAGCSATVLAIAPDNTVRYATTIVEP